MMKRALLPLLAGAFTWFMMSVAYIMDMPEIPNSILLLFIVTTWFQVLAIGKE